MEVTKQYRTETGHRLMDYDGRCAHLHGHSYLWEVTVWGAALDKRDMVVDFKDLKGAMKAVLDPFDHALLLRQDDPLAPLDVLDHATNGDRQRVILLPFNPTAEALAGHVADEVQRLLLTGNRVTRVRVWETATSFATWERDDDAIF